MEGQEKDGKTIVIIDDNSSSLIAASLSTEGYNVISVKNSFTLMSVLHRFSASLVIINPKTGWVSAGDLCRIIKESGRYNLIKILFLREKDDIEEVCKTSYPTADDFLETPFTYSNLISKIKNLI